MAAGAHQRIEVTEIVLVIGGVELGLSVAEGLGVGTDRGQRRRRQVVRIRRRCVVLERLVMGDVVVLVAVVRAAGDGAAGTAEAARPACTPPPTCPTATTSCCRPPTGPATPPATATTSTARSPRPPTRTATPPSTPSTPAPTSADAQAAVTFRVCGPSRLTSRIRRFARPESLRLADVGPQVDHYVARRTVARSTAQPEFVGKESDDHGRELLT